MLFRYAVLVSIHRFNGLYKDRFIIFFRVFLSTMLKKKPLMVR